MGLHVRAICRVLALGAAVAALGCGPPSRVATWTPDPAAPVVVQAAEARDVTFSATKVAVLRADKEVDLNFAAPGTLGRFLVDEGAVVEEGQDVAALDATAFKAQLQEAQVKLEGLIRDRARVEGLYRKNLATQLEYDRVVTLSDQAREQASALRTSLDKLVLRSPMKGLLVRRLAEPGTFVVPGMPVAKVVRMTPLKADLEFTDAERGSVVGGSTLELKCDSVKGRTFTGTLSARVPALDPASQLSRVEVAVANEDGLLKPGMMVKAVVVTARRRRVVTVPIDSLVYEGDELCVYVHDQAAGAARKRPVVAGEFSGTRVIVERGLQPGEPLIVSGQGFIRDGAAVRLVAPPGEGVGRGAP